jgi:hypothetical protein
MKHIPIQFSGWVKWLYMIIKYQLLFAITQIIYKNQYLMITPIFVIRSEKTMEGRQKNSYIAKTFKTMKVVI